MTRNSKPHEGPVTGAVAVMAFYVTHGFIDATPGMLPSRMFLSLSTAKTAQAAAGGS